MNPRGLIIALSLLINVALVLGLVWRASPRGASGGPATSRPAAVDPTATSPAEPEAAPDDWQALRAGSLADVAARLQAEGFPPRLQRAILRALVSEQFADRHRAIADMIRARPWWRVVFGFGESGELMRAQQQLRRDEAAAVDAILGPDPGDSEYVRASHRYRYGDLPPAKLRELDRINADYNELTQEVHRAAQGLLLAEDRETLLFLERERRADIVAQLTPEQLFEYDLRSSPTAWWLRQQLGAMEATEQEFRAIFRIQSEHVAPYADGNYPLMSSADRAALEKLNPSLAEKIKAVLPPERFAAYELTTDPAYRPTDAVVKRLELPPSATAEILGIQKEITKRAEVLRANASLAPAERDAQLGALADEAAARLTPTLGDNGLAAYKETAGRWLNTLRPRPNPAPPKG